MCTMDKTILGRYARRAQAVKAWLDAKSEEKSVGADAVELTNTDRVLLSIMLLLLLCAVGFSSKGEFGLSIVSIVFASAIAWYVKRMEKGSDNDTDQSH